MNLKEFCNEILKERGLQLQHYQENIIKFIEENKDAEIRIEFPRVSPSYAIFQANKNMNKYLGCAERKYVFIK